MGVPAARNAQIPSVNWQPMCQVPNALRGVSGQKFISRTSGLRSRGFECGTYTDSKLESPPLLRQSASLAGDSSLQCNGVPRKPLRAEGMNPCAIHFDARPSDPSATATSSSHAAEGSFAYEVSLELSHRA